MMTDIKNISLITAFYHSIWTGNLGSLATILADNAELIFGSGDHIIGQSNAITWFNIWLVRMGKENIIDTKILNFSINKTSVNYSIIQRHDQILYYVIAEDQFEFDSEKIIKVNFKCLSKNEIPENIE